MKAKVLYLHYGIESGQKLLRIYFEYDFEQAEKDKAMLKETGDNYVELVEVEIFNYSGFINEVLSDNA